MKLAEKPLFSVGGVGVAIDPSWFVIFALVLASLAVGYVPAVFPGHSTALYWTASFVIALLFFASVLTHELAHAWVSNRLGVEVRTITLFLFGGVAHLSSEPDDATTDLKIAIAGPLTSFGLGIGFAGLAALGHSIGLEPLWVGAANYLAILNVMLGAFNSLPGLPLDGGRILRSVLWRRNGDFHASTLQAARTGRALATGLIAFGAVQALLGNLVGGFWLVLIGLFLRGAAEATRRAMQVDLGLAGVTVADVMVQDPIVVPADTTVSALADEYFLHFGFGGFPVVEDERVAGLVSLQDVRKCRPEERPLRTVREIMTPAEPPVLVSRQTPLADVLKKMDAAGSNRLLVGDGHRVAGLITRSGVSRFLQVRAVLEAA